MRKFRSITVLFLMCALFSVPSVFAEEKNFAGYMTPEEAGFRNTALIYTNPKADCAYFEPLLVKFEEDRPTAQAGYDAFLFLCYNINGKHTEAAETTRADWEQILETFFLAERQVPALDEAVGTLREDGFLPEKTCVPVMFAIPWLNPKVTDFGDVDGDGQTENLARIADREKVLNWYMDTVARRLERFPNLRLWGFYMMREALGEKDEENAKLYCDTIHKKGWKAIWIPYFRGPGYDRAYDFGFDVVIMQSNWTFTTRPHGEGSRRNRLVLTADLARDAHMGVELEMAGPKEEIWRSIFRRTLETGTQTGLQRGVGATYFGADFYWPTSENPADRAIYAIWMDYLAGKPIALPESGSWKRTKNNETIIYTFPEKTPVQFVDVFLKETEDAFFRGCVQVEGRETPEAPWKPVAYGFRAKFDPRNGIHQNFTLELPSREYSQLKITLKPEKGCEVSKIEDIQTEFVPMENPNTVSSLCTGKPYVTSDSVPAQYPDATGRELMDGVTSGNWEKYVGWNTNYVSAELFAENEVTFDEIRVYTLEDLSSGIRLPEGITCLSTRDATAELGLKGFGSFPAGFEILDEFHYDPALSAMVGHFSRPVTASHVRLLFQKDGWLFLSEIQFYKDGELLNSAPWRYTLSPQAPSARERGVQYGDDGKMLTDGKLSTAFSRDALGVYNGQTVSVTLDLQRLAPIHRVVAHVLDGGSAGITLPRNITVQISSDGQTWDAPACLFLPESEKLPELVVKSAYADVNHPSTRYIRLNMTARTWAFLTEVEVK